MRPRPALRPARALDQPAAAQASTRLRRPAALPLDRSFAGLSVAPSEAAKRREELRAALRRIVDLALELDVDALTVGGDLYEHERAGPDTGNFIAAEFARFAPKPVLLAPGNHDPYVPDSLYWRLEWPPNVHIFQTMSWEPVELSDTLTLWGAGHRGPAVRDNLLATLNVEADRTNIALVHASDISAVPEGKPAHCPFTREDIERSGLDFALLGHYHELRLRPQEFPRYAYPGSPEPIIDKPDTPFALEQTQEESPTRGAFVRMLQQQMAAAPPADLPVLQNALHFGLRAFAGQEIRRR